MSDTSIGFRIMARDNASPTFNRVGKAADRTGSKMRTFGKVGKAAALGLAAGVVSLGYATMKLGKAAAEDEVSAKLMARQFRNSADATREQIKATESWITTQGVAKGVADDELRPALSNLIRATGDVGKAQRLASIGMNVAATTGKKLGGISIALAKAYAGNSSGLSKLGIKTKNAAGETKTFAQIQKDLTSQFGGAATAKAATLAGKMSRLKVVFSEAGEAIGYKLIPILTSFATWVTNKGMPAVSGFGKKIKEKLQGPFESFGNWISGTGLPALGKLSDKLKSIRDMVSDIDFNNIDGKKLGTSLAEGVEDGFKKLGAMAGSITGSIGSLIDGVNWGELALKFGKQAPALLLGLATGILNFDFGSVFRFAADHWGELLAGVLTIAFAPSKVIGPLAKALERIPFVGKFAGWLLKSINKVGGKAKTFLKDMFGVFWKAFKDAAPSTGAIGGFVGKVMRFFTGIPGKISSFFSRLAGRVFTWAVDAFEAMGKGAGKAAERLLTAVGKLPGKVIRGLGNLGSLLLNAGKDLITGLISGIGKKFDDVKAKLGELTGKLTSWKGPPKKDKILLTPAGEMLMDGLIAGINKKQRSVKNVLEKLTSYIQKKMSKLSDLKGIKSGFLSTFQGTNAFGTDVSEGGGFNAILTEALSTQGKSSTLNNDIQTLIGKGLSKSLLKQLQEQGFEGADQAHALANATADQIAQLNAANAATSKSLQSAGLTLGDRIRGGSVSADIKQEQRDIKLAKGIAAELRKLPMTGELKAKGDTLIAVINSTKRRKGQKGI